MTPRLLIPQDLEAEAALLGSLLQASNTTHPVDWHLDDLLAGLQRGMFCDPAHQQVLDAIVDTHSAGEPMDWRTVLPRLNRASAASDADWESELASIAEEVPTPVNAPHYAKRVVEKWRARELLRALDSARTSLSASEPDVGDVLTALSRRVEDIEQTQVQGREPTPETTLLQGMVNPRRTSGEKVPIGLGDLQYQLDGGLEMGTLTVIGARPSCGKTSLGLGLCTTASTSSEGCPSLFVSCEMTAEQVGLRLLAMRANASIRNIRQGRLGDEEFETLRATAVQSARDSADIYVLDRERNIRAIGGMIRRVRRKWGVRLVVVDYLQRCSLAGRFDRDDQRVGAMVKFLKDVAQDENVAIVVLSQFSRQGAKENRQPRLDDFRESGQIEEEADNAILIHKTAEVNGDLHSTLFIVAKQRQGNIGKVTVNYHAPTMRYVAALP